MSHITPTSVHFAFLLIPAHQFLIRGTDVVQRRVLQVVRGAGGHGRREDPPGGALVPPLAPRCLQDAEVARGEARPAQRALLPRAVALLRARVGAHQDVLFTHRVHVPVLKSITQSGYR